MAKRYRVYLAWRGREDDLRDMSRQTASFLSALGALHPLLKGFRFIDRATGKEAAASGNDACQRALEAYRVDWATGETKRVAYQPRFFVERKAAPPVEIELTCGIERLNLGPIYTPNRLDLLMRRDAPDNLASPGVLEGIVRAGVEAFRPDWGFAGVEGVPDPPLAVFSDGVPSVGWMTFLSSKYPPVPAALPKPAVSHVLARRGTLIIAHPDLFDERDPAHIEAVEKVRQALAAAGVLVPAEALDQAPRSTPG
jgi:hypothetical protein